MKRHYSLNDLALVLDGDSIENNRIRRHLRVCHECWKKWNKKRWDNAKDKKGFIELQEYLGKDFTWYLDSSRELADQWNKANPTKIKDIENFYQHTDMYLYNLMIWYESGDRYNLLSDLYKIIDTYNISSCLDYGCGIGNDGLNMLISGLDVYFYDFDNPSLKFLEWRLNKRKLNGKILKKDLFKIFPKVEMVWAVDVLEHMVNPLEVFEAFSDETKVFAHISQFGDKSEGRHPFHFDFHEDLLIDELKRHGFRFESKYEHLSVWIKK